jgi:uncharacterized protein (DUF885 family)
MRCLKQAMGQVIRPQRPPGASMFNASRILVILVFFSTAFCQAHAGSEYSKAQIVKESAKANALFDKVFDRKVARSPIWMAYLGIKKDTDRWDDISDARALENLISTSRDLSDLKNINFDALDEQSKLSYRMFERDAQSTIEGWKWRHYNYPLTQQFGLHSEAPAFLINLHPIANTGDAKAYIARLRGMAPLMDQLIANAKLRETEQIIAPRFAYPIIADSIKLIISGAPFDTSDKKSALWEDFENKVKKLQHVDSATKKSLLTQGRKALTISVKPAYTRLLAALMEQEKIATDDVGVWKFPQGDAYYAYALREATTTQMSPEQIHQLGLREVDRIHAEMQTIVATIGFKGDLKAFFEFIKHDPKFKYPDTAEGKADYVKRATRIVDDMRLRLDEFFITKPKAGLLIRQVEPFREQGAAGAFYEAPSADGTRPGVYYVNTFRMNDVAIYGMETLAHHEALPGHHMQIAIAQELKGLPKFRKFGGNDAYTEGWALYSEYFPKEFDFYTDPYMDFGRLNDELLRAVRLVVDTGLHSKRWTREQVIQYFQDNTPNSERDIKWETERYIMWPAQATSYKIGMLKILELRELARSRLGKKFDIRRYHDLILKNGAVPMDLLEEIVGAWIEREKT